MMNIANSNCSDDKNSQSQQQHHGILGGSPSQFPNIIPNNISHTKKMNPEQTGGRNPGIVSTKISNWDYNEFQLKSNKWNEKLSLQDQKQHKDVRL